MNLHLFGDFFFFLPKTQTAWKTSHVNIMLLVYYYQLYFDNYFSFPLRI